MTPHGYGQTQGVTGTARLGGLARRRNLRKPLSRPKSKTITGLPRHPFGVIGTHPTKLTKKIAFHKKGKRHAL
jgi:hypothetical protein